MPKYWVCATEDVVKEMARYEEAQIERAEFVRFGRLNPITDEDEAIRKCSEIFGEDSLASMLDYRWIIVSDHLSLTRWASFQTAVHIIED